MFGGLFGIGNALLNLFSSKRYVSKCSDVIVGTISMMIVTSFLVAGLAFFLSIASGH